MESLKDSAEIFWTEGYLVLESFFSPALMDQANEMILSHYGLNPKWEHNDEFIQKSAVEVVPWFPYREGNKKLDEIAENEGMLLLTQAILGDQWKDLYCMAMFSKKGSRGQAWHQDCPPDHPEVFNLNRLVYTHDITPETGGEIVVFPRAHHAGILPAGNPEEDLPGQLSFTPAKGTLIFLHGHCWHKVKPVKSEYRISTNFRAVPDGVPDDITDICVYRNMRYKFSTAEIIETRTA